MRKAMSLLLTFPFLSFVASLVTWYRDRWRTRTGH